MFEQDIERLLTYNDWTSKLYRGVFARDDDLPSLEGGGIIVVNTDRRQRPGEHWILYANMNDKLIYFDSFGLPPIEPELRHLIVDEYNDTCIQSLYSPLCGVYCCIVAALLARGKPLKSIVSRFSNNLIANDVKSIKILERLFVA